MSRKLLIVLMNTDPRNVEELGAPFYHAAVAAAMDYQVDVVCTATAGKLMQKGIADKLFIKAGNPRTGYDWIKESHEQWATCCACPAKRGLLEIPQADRIPGCKGLMGAAAMLRDTIEVLCGM